FERDYVRMSEAGVVFTQVPRREKYGTVAVFEDLYGNRFDLIQRAEVIR
ncbi:MAG: VOC family protein, partial [Phycisphaerales bacterium]